MTDTITGFRRSLNIELDWITATLLGLFAGFQALTLYAVGLDFTPPQQQSASMVLPAKFFAVMLAEVAVLVAVWRAWQYLSEWLQTIIKYAIYGGIAGILASIYIPTVYSLFAAGQPAIAGIYAITPFTPYLLFKYTKADDYAWIAFNLIAFGIGVTATVIASHVLAPIALIPLMIGVLVYDYIAVDLTDIMGDLINFSSSVGIPNYLIIPSQPTVDLETVQDYVSGDSDGDQPESVAFIIGVGDFIFPTALVASSYIAHSAVTLAVAGGVLGTLAAAVTLRAALADGGALPALPWLNSGAILGYCVGLAGMVVL